MSRCRRGVEVNVLYRLHGGLQQWCICWRTNPTYHIQAKLAPGGLGDLDWVGRTGIPLSLLPRGFGCTSDRGGTIVSMIWEYETLDPGASTNESLLPSRVQG